MLCLKFKTFYVNDNSLELVIRKFKNEIDAVNHTKLLTQDVRIQVSRPEHTAWASRRGKHLAKHGRGLGSDGALPDHALHTKQALSMQVRSKLVPGCFLDTYYDHPEIRPPASRM